MHAETRTGAAGAAAASGAAPALRLVNGEWWWPIAGAVLLAHFAVMVAIKLWKGLGDDILWMSHTALLVAGAGLLLRRPWVVAAALTGIMLTHALWLFDVVAWVFGFGFPLHIAPHMEDAGLSTWISTGHHLYLLPLLLVIVIRCSRYPWRAYAATLVLFAGLTLACSLFTSAERNVNRVHGIEPDFGFSPFIWANTLEGLPYVLALNALAAVILFLPAALLLHILTALMHGRALRERNRR